MGFGNVIAKKRYHSEERCLKNYLLYLVYLFLE